jgi:hypothetical protein
MLRGIALLLVGLSLQVGAAELTRQRTFDVPFPASDLAFDAARNRAFVINANTKEVLALDLANGAISNRYSFANRPETLALRPDGKRLYVAMPAREHSYYWFDGHTGYVGEVNLELNEKTREFLVDVDPYGIIATDQGWIVIPDGSGQWTEIVSFNASTGARVSTRMIRQMSTIALHPSQAQFYTADTDSSPSDIESWKLNSATGEITGGNDSPYHGDYPMGGRVFISPTGTNLITAGGGLFTTSTDPEKDMRHIATLTGGFVRAAYFDALHKAIFTAGQSAAGGGALSYYGPGYYLVRQYPIQSDVRYMTGDSNTLTLVRVRADRTTFDFFTHPAIGAESNAAPVVNFVWTPDAPTTTNLVTLDASSTTDDDGSTNLVYRWDFEADGTWETTFANTPTTTVRYNIGGTKTIRLEVMDRFGAVTRLEKSLNVPFASDPGTPGGGNAAFQLPFQANDLAFDSKNLRLFATDTGGKRLVVLNLTNGFIEREFSFIYPPEHLAISPNGRNLYVTLPVRPHSAYWFSSHTGYVAQISLDTLTKVGEVRVDLDPYKIVATDNDLLAISGGSDQWTELNIVKASTGEILGETGVYMGAYVALHPNQEALYFSESNLSPSDFARVNFNPTTGAVISAWDSPYHGDYAIGGQPFVSPDGRYVFSPAGAVLSSSADRLLDMRFVTNLAGGSYSWLHFDPANHAFFTVGGPYWGTNTFRYFNENLELVSTENLTNSADRIYGQGDTLWLAARTANRTTVYQRRNPALGANSNQPPVANFNFLPANLTTVTHVTVEANISTDPEGAPLWYRWDWEADGTYDTDFSTNYQARHRYIAPGTHTVRLQVKDSYGVLDEAEKSFQVVLDSFPGLPYGPEPNQPYNIPYRIETAAFSKINSYLFVVPAESKNVEVIDLETGYLDRQFVFEYRPASIAITPNGKRMYAAFTKGHEYYSGGKAHIGYVAEFDLEQMVLTREMELPIDPADIVATDSGLLIISDGSDQHTQLSVFNAATGEKVGTTGIYMGMQLALHPSQQMVYGETVGLSPADIHHFNLSESGAITEQWDSPYHGDYAMGSDVFIFPDRPEVFSPQGSVFTSTATRSTDLLYLRKLPLAYIYSAAFDTNRGIMLAAHESSISFMNYQSDAVLLQKPLQTPRFVGFYGNRAAVVSVRAADSIISFHSVPSSDPASNRPPVISVKIPETTELTLNVGAYQPFEIEATDEDGTISQIQLYRGTNVAVSWLGSTLSARTEIVPGTNLFHAIAYDNMGATATSQVYRVFGNTPPSASFLYPPQDAFFTTLGTIVFRVAANDPDGSVESVELYRGEQLVGTSTVAPYEFSFTPSIAGSFQFRVKVTDVHGASTFSAPLNVRFGGIQDQWSLDLGVFSGTNLNLTARTVTATRQKGEPLHAGQPGGRSVWWAWLAPDDGAVVLETAGSDFDTLLAVYARTGNITAQGFTNLTLVAANDDDPLNAPASRVKFTAVKGMVYHIAIDGRDGVSGDAELSLRFTPSIGPDNDLLGSAARLVQSAAPLVSTIGASKEPGEPAHAGNSGGASVWWRFETGAGSLPIQITTEGSSFDTLLAVYTNVDAKITTPPRMSDLRLVAANDDGFLETTLSKVVFTSRSYAVYWIAVDGFNGAAGTARLRVTFPGNQAPAPINNYFANATILSGAAAVTHTSTRFANIESSEPQHAGKEGGASVWYKWVAPSNGPTYVSTKASDFDTLLAVYTGSSLSALTPVASNDDDPANLQTSALIFNATAGTEYKIAVAGYQGASGNLVLALNQNLGFAPRLITQFSGGRLSVTADAVGTYVLESSADLQDWRFVCTITGSEAILDLQPPESVTAQFYRVRLAQ